MGHVTDVYLIRLLTRQAIIFISSNMTLFGLIGDLAPVNSLTKMSSKQTRRPSPR